VDDNMNDRMLLLKKLQASDFALVELGLYLDTHPDDKAALAYFAKFLAVKKQLHEEFTKKYGPIRIEDYDGSPYWKWIDNPWPWEMERGV
jgi:spore coat protein JB